MPKKQPVQRPATMRITPVSSDGRKDFEIPLDIGKELEDKGIIGYCIDTHGYMLNCGEKYNLLQHRI